MLNRCEFIGNLGADPEQRTFQNGNKVTTGERKEKTEWVSVAVFGPLADTAANYLRKGSKVYVAGKFTTRKWQDQTGQDRYSTEIVLQGFDAKLVMLDSRGDSQDGYKPAPEPAQGPSDDYADDIPF